VTKYAFRSGQVWLNKKEDFARGAKSVVLFLVLFGYGENGWIYGYVDDVRNMAARRETCVIGIRNNNRLTMYNL